MTLSLLMAARPPAGHALWYDILLMCGSAPGTLLHVRMTSSLHMAARFAACTQIASDTIAQRLKISRGALLQGVQSDGAGAKAGLLPTRRGLSGIIAGDVIVAVNDVQIFSGAALMK